MWQCNSSKNMAFAVFSYNYKPLPSDRAAINAIYKRLRMRSLYDFQLLDRSIDHAVPV